MMTNRFYYPRKINLVASGQEKSLTQEEVNPSEKLVLKVNISIDEIVKFIPGPDFPTGGAIYDAFISYEFSQPAGRML